MGTLVSSIKVRETVGHIFVNHVEGGCSSSGCGNGLKEGSEQCDDGNKVSGDGCSASCQLEMPTPRCGNRYLDDGEQCEDGNAVSGDGCSATCQKETLTCPVTPPPANCKACDGKVKTLTLRYNGTASKEIKITDKDGNIVFNGTVAPNGTFTCNGKDKNGTLGTTIAVYTKSGSSYTLNTNIHTSCSQPIGPFQSYGDFTIMSGESLNGGNLCQIQ
jgi:cysteine-rich repeat protein